MPDSSRSLRKPMPQLEPFAIHVFSGFSAPLLGAIESAPLPGLGPGPTDSKLTAMLLGADLSDLWGSIPHDCHDEFLSGLWLLAGNLDRSHTISQGIDGPEGCFWHGIMHRREGDFSNAKYWFRRVGSHDVFAHVASLVPDIYRDPFEFVDLCSELSRGAAEGDAQVTVSQCQRAQWMEWQSLMVHCGRATMKR